MSALVRRIIVCTLAGMLVSAAIAWTAAFVRPAAREWPGLFVFDRHGEFWMAHGERGLGWGHLTLYGATGLTDAGEAMAKPLPWWIDTPREGEMESRCTSVIGAGWPMIALRAECVGVGHADPAPGAGWRSGLGPQWIEWQSWRGAMGDGDALPTNPSVQRPMPMQIMWRGFVMNALFWSAVCAVPLLLGVGLRAVRKRKGRCPMCGYDLRRETNAGCPECGWRRTDHH